MKKTDDGREISNVAYKKEQASVHNQTLELVENILQMGECACGGSLFMYIKSRPENYFKYYCTDCSSQGDIRTPKKKDVIYNGPSKVLDYITINAYGEDEIEKHINDKSCANRSKRAASEESIFLKESRFEQNK